ncbi:MAG: hypothetical protein WDO15_08825 [Bacteroidota bacterium]
MTVYYMVHRGTKFKKVLFPSFFSIITLNFIFNTHFYPNLLRYESGNVAAKVAVDKKMQLVGLNYNPYGTDFYYGKQVPRYADVIQLTQNERVSPILVYTDVAGVEQLRNSPVKILEDTVLHHFHVSSVNGRFLSPKTRNSATQEMHLLLIKF